MTVLDILAKRNADKLRAVEADGASVRYHLRMRDGVVGIIDAFELFDGVSLMFNSIPRGTAEWDDREPCELQIDWCRRGRFELDAANGRAIRLNEGELAFHDERVLKRVMAFPSPLYTGLTLRIDRSVGAASLERSMRLLESDLESAVTLRDAANAADMSVSSFKERFVRAFGISPMAYRRQCRLECAARLLETTGESVARIALSVGYRNPSKLSPAFASAFSHSPSEHRALHRDGERGHGRINPTA